MRILMWHVHGSWTTAFVQGRHEVVIPVDPERGPDGRGRARTWDWPARARERTADELADDDLDCVVLQRPHELELCRQWTGRTPGSDLPAIYLEHNTPTGHAARTRHPMADQKAIPVVHVTHFNRLMWDCGSAPTTVIEHGVPDPGLRYTGEDTSLAAVANEPARRDRIVGTDLLLKLGQDRRIDLYGMGMADLAGAVPSAQPGRGIRLHDDYPQDRLLQCLPRHRAYVHLCRWTSLGLSLIEAMLLGMPVLALDATEASAAVPPAAGLVTCDLAALARQADTWTRDAGAARAAGLAAREHALEKYGLARFLDDWDRLLERATS